MSPVKLLRCLSVCLVAILVLFGHQPVSAASHVQQAASHRVIITFVTQPDVDSLPQNRGQNMLTQLANQRNRVAAGRAALLRLPSMQAANIVSTFSYVPAVVAELDTLSLGELQNQPGVLAIQEDQLDEASLLESTALIGAPAVWSQGFTGAGQTVAVIDTGIDSTHPFLANKVVAEACFSNANGQGSGKSVCPSGLPRTTGPGSGTNCIISGCSHGTHVAGIIAGHSTSTIRYSGVAPDSTLASLQVYTRIDTGCTSQPAPCIASYVSDQLAALEYVATLKKSINIVAVNMSLGGGLYTAACDNDVRKSAVDMLRNLGIATIASSGNNGSATAMGAPACISSVISVGSTSDGGINMPAADTISSFSNISSGLQLLAPGQEITSSLPGTGFGAMSGTSMAAPHVAGAWAVLAALKPSASVAEIMQVLSQSGVPITDPRNQLTRPRIQLDQAVYTLLDWPLVTIQNAAASEGDSADFVVQLAHASTQQIQLQYATSKGTALADADYVSQSGSLTFAPGVTQQHIRVPLIDDVHDEDDETFVVTLSEPTNAYLKHAQAVGTIIDNDDPPTASLVSGTISANAAGSYDLKVVVAISEFSDKRIDITYSAEYGGATQTESLVLSPGMQRITQTVPLGLPFSTSAGAEVVTVQLLDAQGAVIDQRESVANPTLPAQHSDPVVGGAGNLHRVYVPFASH